MRRAPTFSRSRRRTRQDRLRRTILGISAAFVLLGLTFRLCGSDDTIAEAPLVAFVGETQTDGAPTPEGSAATSEAAAAQIRDEIDAWFQAAFADPRRYGDGSFDEVGELFVGEAGIGFVEDRGILTIGDLAPEVRRVTIETQVANVVLYLDAGQPIYATAAIRFRARLGLRDDAPDVRLTQRASAVFERRDGAWRITNYYDAEQRRDEIEPEGSSS